jgi:hypothetical protein
MVEGTGPHFRLLAARLRWLFFSPVSQPAGRRPREFPALVRLAVLYENGFPERSEDNTLYHIRVLRTSW